MALALSLQGTGWLHRLQVSATGNVYIGLFVFSEQLVIWFHFPLPANIVGMLVLLTLIICRVMPLGWVKAGASWLLEVMLLFFVPAVVAVVNYAELLRLEGWRILLVIGLSTLLVLAATLLVVERVYRCEIWLAQRKQGKRDA